MTAGAKYDSYIVQSLGADLAVNENEDDVAGYGTFSAYWQHRFSGQMGLRADYSVYADLHEKFKKNDVIEHLFSVEPQWFEGNLIFSLPLQYVYARENNAPKNHRYSAAPTVTLGLPDLNQAVALYARFSRILDVDPYPSFDEDGDSAGGGLAYLISLKGRNYFRIMADYERTHYGSRAWDYLNESSPNMRHDIASSLGVVRNFQLTRRFDLIAGYTFIHTHSNVNIYDYDKHIVQAGVSFKF